MKKFVPLLLTLIMPMTFLAQAQIVLDEFKTFPTAGGAARFTGINSPTRSLYVVTNLSDSGVGSLRDAMSQSNRDIIFAVSGNIELNDIIETNAGNLRIHGQTAPGDGVAIVSNKNVPAFISALVRFDSNNCMMRHLRVRRYGEQIKTNNGGVTVLRGDNYIFDHLTVSWCTDDMVGGTYNGGGRYTLQNSLIYESVPKADQTGIDGKGTLFYNDITDLSMIENVWAHIGQRTPSVSTYSADLKFEMYNNIIYNRDGFGASLFYRDNDSDSGLIGNVADASITANIVGNKFIEGDDTITDRYDFALEPDSRNRVYVRDNLSIQRPTNDLPQWDVVGNHSSGNSEEALPSNGNQSFSPVITSTSTSDLIPLGDLEQEVLSHVGASLKRDDEDSRIINEIQTRTGNNINAPNPNLNYPLLASGSSPQDNNNNGIADSFESTHDLSGDGTNVTVNWNFGTYTVVNNAGYTDREIYWAWLAKDFDNLESTETPNSFTINENDRQITTYNSQDDGFFSVVGDGTTLRLTGNSWKKAQLDYTITPNTILEFDFRVDGRGEIHGIGFDDNTTLDTSGSTGELFFKLFGTQDVVWDNTDFENYSQGQGWKRYSIPLGDYITGEKQYIVFFGDKDSGPSSQDSSFRNVTLRETIIGKEEIWLEAECASVGSNWGTVDDTDASSGRYLLAPGGNNYNVAPSNQSSMVSFDFNASAGSYKLYARVKVPTTQDDSFWVRANGGDWLKWNMIPGGDYFSWHRVHENEDSSSFITFDLVNGSNTVNIAHREDGAGLDKLYLTYTSKSPSGLVVDDIDCSGNPITMNSVAFSATNASQSSQAIDTEVESYRVYPNPTTNTINIRGIKGQKDISITDLSGKIVYRETSSESRPTIDLSDYTPGTYFIKVSGDNSTETFTVLRN